MGPAQLLFANIPARLKTADWFGLPNESLHTSDLVARITNFQLRRPANKNRMPFVNKLDDLIHDADDIRFSHILVLGEQSGSKYKGHSRISFCYDHFLQGVRVGSAEWKNHPKAPYVLSAHGSEHSVDLSKMVAEMPQEQLSLKLLDAGNISYSLEAFPVGHRFLAKMIKRDPAFDKNRFMVLLSCDASKSDYAQNLANSLGVPVIAPNELIWANNTGHLIVAQEKAGSKLIEMDLSKLGQFKQFYPGKPSSSMRPMPGGRDSIILLMDSFSR